MLYLKEIFFRGFYTIFSFILALIIFYVYVEDFILCLIIPTQKSKYLIQYFIFTDPNEILFMYISYYFMILILFYLPLIFYHIIDFFKQGLYYQEYQNYIQKFKLGCWIYMINNIFFYIVIFPLCWNFFSSYNMHLNSINFYLELSALRYYYFFFSLLCLNNILFLLIFFSLNITIKNKLKIFEYKRYMIVIFLIIATVLTPPDFFSQLFIFLILYVCFELYLFIILVYSVYRNNFYKFIKEAN